MGVGETKLEPLEVPVAVHTPAGVRFANSVFGCCSGLPHAGNWCYIICVVSPDPDGRYVALEPGKYYAICRHFAEIQARGLTDYPIEAIIVGEPCEDEVSCPLSHYPCLLSFGFPRDREINMGKDSLFDDDSHLWTVEDWPTIYRKDSGELVFDIGARITAHKDQLTRQRVFAVWALQQVSTAHNLEDNLRDLLPVIVLAACPRQYRRRH